MIDRVLEIELGKIIKGIKNVTVDGSYFPEHFPDQPVMSRVLILEALARISGLLLRESTKAWRRKAFFMAVDKVKLRRPIIPGDRLILEAEMLRMGGTILKTIARATVEAELVSESEILLSLID
jgi:3-hydroxymyristoyl/3-hydroxydecanoyl-(acyl carrier protein) dehydratase